MRILQIIDTLNIGGAEKVCLDLITLLLDAGDHVDCLVISTKGPLFDHVDKRATVWFLNRKNKYNLIKLYKCASLASKYDIVHVHMRHTWAYVRFSAILFKRIKNLVFHDHFWEVDLNSKVSLTLKGIFKPKHYIGVSEAHIIWAKKCLKNEPNNVYLLSNTIIPKYKKAKTYSGDWVMVSNLRQIKNLSLGIELATKMKRFLVIFGNHDGSVYADSVLAAAQASGFVHIVQNETNIQQYLGNFNIALHTAFSETGPLVLMEYLAHGLPFITSKNGEVVNQVKNELPEMIADSFNVEEWIAKITSLETELKIHREQLQHKLKSLFEHRFSPQNYIEKCQQIYQSVLNS